jgi:ABC-type antimicrobial peptide transport system permease subunit
VQWATIIGVVGDIRTESLTREILPQIYLPYQRAPGRAMAVVVRGGEAAVEEVRRAVSAVDPGVALFAVAGMEERLAAAVSGPRFRLLLFGGYTVFSFALAVFGIYSMMSYSVACRARELAIRVAVGATNRGLVTMLAGEALRLVAAGAACGLGLAAAGSGVLRGLLFGVSAVEGWSYGLAALVAVGVCTAAALVPAWRATRVATARVLQDLV